MPFEFHIGVLPDRPVEEVAALAAYAEELGFAGFWVADSQSIFRDAFSTLTACAARTSRLQLATGVTNPVTRHPAVLAGAFATLDELSGRRTTIGIGVGESAVETIGAAPATLAQLEETTMTLRALLAGDETTHDGHAIRMTWTSTSIPVYFASSGPRSLRLSGRMADGVLFQVGADPAFAGYALDAIAEGSAGRPLKRLMRLACSVDHDRTAARESVRPYAAVAAGTVYRNVPHEVIDDAVLEDVRALKEAYDYFEHGSARARHQELVTERILDAVAIAGTPEEAVPRFRELMRLDFDGFVLPVTSRDPFATLRLLADEVVGKL